MKENELMDLVEQTSVLMERYQHNTDKAAQNNANIVQNLQHLTQGLQRLHSEIPQSIKTGAYNAIKEGMAQSVRESNEVLQNATGNLKFETQRLKEDRDKVYQMAKWLSYKTIGLVYGSAVLIWLVSAFFAWSNIQSAKQAIKKAEWISGINASIATGKLTACPEGGVCSNVNGKLVRLDK